jgi:potassium-transporting ATPase KdpC subunit
MKLRDLVHHIRPLLAILVLFAVLLMAAYPLVLAGIDSSASPNSAAGSPLYCNGNNVGSSLIGQNVTTPMLFHIRNASSSDSGVDPDITPADAYGQVPTVSNATGIPESSLNYLIAQNIAHNEAENAGILAPDYVDVNALNVELIQLYPSIYAGYCSS